MEYINDTVAPSRRVFLLPLPEGLLGPLAAALPTAKGPAAIALRLERSRLQSAYRGAGVFVTPEFHGFLLGRPFECALRAVEELDDTLGVVRDEARAWVRPLLWLRYRARDTWWDVATWIADDGIARVLVRAGTAP